MSCVDRSGHSPHLTGCLGTSMYAGPSEATIGRSVRLCCGKRHQWAKMDGCAEAKVVGVANREGRSTASLPNCLKLLGI